MNRAVFLDRDDTIIDDPGYLSDPNAIHLLPGVEQAVKSLRQAGYKIIVCTNQSGIARGILTEDTLDKIHAELRRQLAQGGAHLDAIYHCPYHPEGTVEAYARESDWRKPQPGMLLKAAEDFQLDLSKCWMVGDSSRDVEAGQRAGCRTVRVRVSDQNGNEEEDAQADYTVRNLSEASRIILKEDYRDSGQTTSKPLPAIAPTVEQPQNSQPQDAGEEISDRRVRLEILSLVRQLVRRTHEEEFSFLKLAGGIAQMLALVVLVKAISTVVGPEPDWSAGTFWAVLTVALQVMALTLFTLKRSP